METPAMGDLIASKTPQELGLHGKRQSSISSRKMGAQPAISNFPEALRVFAPVKAPRHIRTAPTHKLLLKRRASGGHERFVLPGAGHAGLGHQLKVRPSDSP